MRVVIRAFIGAVCLGACLSAFADGLGDSVVTFNEIHYHPATSSEVEWIELHNQMSLRLDLADWKLSGGIDFVFPAGTVIEPKGFLLVASGPMEGTLGPFSGSLANGGEWLRLRDRNGRILDEVRYADSEPWPLGPDGSGSSLSKRRAFLASGDVESWVANTPSPGAANPVESMNSPLRFTEIAAAASEGFWMEVENIGSAPIALEEYGVLHRGILWPNPQGTLAPGGFALITLDEVISGSGEKVFLMGQRGLADTAQVKLLPQARLAGPRWYSIHGQSATPGSPNRVSLNEAIVINEIMYHFPPFYDQPDTLANDFAENREEWIELYNRGDESVSLEGWKLSGGVTYTFPEGSTLDAGSYAVVARDVAAMRLKYPDVDLLGEFSGNLRNSGDRVVLLDEIGNVADEVDYVDSGRWPVWAGGGGSSLELRDPFADNALPGAWAASDESSKSVWTEIAYEGPVREPVRSNNPDIYQEFLMGLLDGGEVLVDDVSVVEDPAGAAVEVIQNGGFSKVNIFSKAIEKWRLLGTHLNSVSVKDPEDATNLVLKLVASGPISHTYNTASSTFANGRKIDENKNYRVSFRARWVHGSPQLNTRLYLNRLARTHILPIPDRLGTPGRQNSQYTERLGPTLDGLRFFPVAPKANETVTVEVQGSDPQGMGAMEVWFRTESGFWQSSTMTPDPNRSGFFLGSIPGQASRSVIQFYVRATDALGAEAFAPPSGVESRALFRVGEVEARAVDSARLLMLTADHNYMRRPEHAVSNGLLGGTFISNDEEVFFDVGVRLRSSPYGRQGNRTGYNVSFGKEHRFRGIHDSIALDRGVVMPNGTSNGHRFVGTGAGPNELLINQIAQKAGNLPTTFDDVLYLETPTLSESGLVQARLARYGSVYLDSQYENGGDGSVHKFELIYYPNRTVDGSPESLKAAYNTVLGIDIQNMRDDKEAYRYNFMLSNNRDRDDFSGIIKLGAAFSSRGSAELRETTQEIMDVDQWMRVFAFESLIGVADTYNMGLAHNLLLYTRPDGKVQPFPWDLDHGFYYTPTAPILGAGGSNLAKVIDLPENRRLFYGHLHDIIDRSYNTDYLRPWIEHISAVTELDWTSEFANYIDRRRNYVLAEISRAVPSTSFKILTNNGLDFESDAPVITLSGTGWIDVRSVVNTTSGALLPLEWTDVDTWEAEVALVPGDNEISLQALDFQGRRLGSIFVAGSDSIHVHYTGEIVPAQTGYLSISEIHYHPADREEVLDPEQLEFIELYNPSDYRVDLAGASFTKGIGFAFPNNELSMILEPGAVGLLVRNRAVFESVYGADLPILAEYVEGQLSNRGETLRLEDRFGRVIQELHYEDGGSWPVAADGVGYSLTFRSGPVDDALSWRASRQSGGTPGLREGARYDDWIKEHPGGMLLDYALIMPLSVDFQARRASVEARADADDAVYTLEYSEDLRIWTGADVPARSSENRVLEWELPEAARYLRVRIHLAE